MEFKIFNTLFVFFRLSKTFNVAIGYKDKTFNLAFMFSKWSLYFHTHKYIEDYSGDSMKEIDFQIGFIKAKILLGYGQP